MKTKSLLIFSLLALLVSSACKPEYARQDPIGTEPRTVVVESLTSTNAPIPIESSGIVSSKIEAKLSFKIAGVVQRILVEEGQRVKKGQLLANLNLAEINAQVVQAQNAVDKAERDFARIERLYHDSVATLEQLQDLKTSVAVNRADLRIARFNQQYAQIVAPSDGKILKRFVEQGELVAAGSPVITYGSEGQDAYIMRVSLADIDVVTLLAGDSASIQFDAYPGRTFSASVTEIAEAADPFTGTFEVELTLNQSKLAIKNGLIGRSSIYPSNQSPYVKISMNALVEGHQQKASVFFYDDQSGQAILSELKPLHIDNTFFTVPADSLLLVKKVITEGSAYIRHGDIVTPNILLP